MLLIVEIVAAILIGRALVGILSRPVSEVYNECRDIRRENRIARYHNNWMESQARKNKLAELSN